MPLVAHASETHVKWRGRSNTEPILCAIDPHNPPTQFTVLEHDAPGTIALDRAHVEFRETGMVMSGELGGSRANDTAVLFVSASLPDGPLTVWPASVFDHSGKFRRHTYAFRIRRENSDKYRCKFHPYTIVLKINVGCFGVVRHCAPPFTEIGGLVIRNSGGTLAVTKLGGPEIVTFLSTHAINGNRPEPIRCA